MLLFLFYPSFLFCFLFFLLIFFYKKNIYLFLLFHLVKNDVLCVNFVVLYYFLL